MQPATEIGRYGMMPRFLHWMTVVLVVLAWTLGTFGDDLPKGPARATGLFVHMSAGLLVLGALVMRLVWQTGRAAAACLAKRIRQMARRLRRSGRPSGAFRALC